MQDTTAVQAPQSKPVIKFYCCTDCGEEWPISHARHNAYRCHMDCDHSLEPVMEGGEC